MNNNLAIKFNRKENYMQNVGVVGLGNMGSGLAKNLIKNGFETIGLDLSDNRMKAFIEMGGKPAKTIKEVGVHSDAVFVMVMNGDQAKSIILGENGLVSHLKKGSVVILTATIKPSEAQEIAVAMKDSEIHLIDSPVSGGFSGAQNGTLTLMAAGEDKLLNKFMPVMEAVSKNVHRVGSMVGQGQTVKACLQPLIGSIIAATSEASVLAAKA